MIIGEVPVAKWLKKKVEINLAALKFPWVICD
jgi:hypothetical protein